MEALENPILWAKLLKMYEAKVRIVLVQKQEQQIKKS